MVYLVNEDGSLTSVTPTKEDKHLSFELPAGFSEGDFVIAWQKYVKPSTDDKYDDSTGSFKERQRKFWRGVENSIENSKPGKVITIGAGDYDQMPVYIMEAVAKHNVGLRIRWNGGKEILPRVTQGAEGTGHAKVLCKCKGGGERKRKAKRTEGKL